MGLAKWCLVLCAAVCAPVAWALPTFDEVRRAHQPSEVLVLSREGEVLQRLRTDASVRRGQWVALPEVSAALRQEPTGQPHGFRGDVASVAKKNLRAGEMLDGEGGYTVWGKLLPAATSAAMGGLPLGLAHNVKLLRAVKKGQSLSWDDVAMDTSTDAYRTRRAMEAMFAPASSRSG